jgi:hypothetical protein
VLKNAQSQVSASETYALAFESFNLPLSVVPSNTNLVISWPLAPAGFNLQSTTNLSSPAVWSAVPSPVTVDTNANRNIVTVPETGENQFFRLQRP